MISQDILAMVGLKTSQDLLQTDRQQTEGKEKRRTSILSLTPAPIPTRFVGRMHAVVSSTNIFKRKRFSDIDLAAEMMDDSKTAGLPTAVRMLGKMQKAGHIWEFK